MFGKCKKHDVIVKSNAEVWYQDMILAICEIMEVA